MQVPANRPQRPASWAGLTTTLAWVNKGAWAVSDQALFAGSNFLLNVLLARWLLPDAYGAFVQAYSMFLLVGTAHGALLIEPMLIFGSGEFRDHLSEYRRGLLSGHWAFSFLLSLPLLAAGFVALARGNHSYGLTLLALGIATPVILFQWLVRRLCYVYSNPRLASTAGGVYMTWTLLGAYVCQRTGKLSGVSALALLGTGSLVSSLWVLIRLPVATRQGGKLSLNAVAAAHWGYGRWALASGVLSWIPANFYYLVLPSSAGLEATAVLKALVNITLPPGNVYAALAVLLVPSLVRARGTERFHRLVRVALTWLPLSALAYYLLIVAGHRLIVAWLYHGQYASSSGLLWLVGLLPISIAAVAVLGAALRSLGRPDQIFWAYVWSSAATVTVGLVLTARLGVAGAAMGMLVSSVTTACGMAWLRRLISAPPQSVTWADLPPPGDR